jgi:hypothetical protein
MTPRNLPLGHPLRKHTSAAAQRHLETRIGNPRHAKPHLHPPSPWRTVARVLLWTLAGLVVAGSVAVLAGWWTS